MAIDIRSIETFQAALDAQGLIPTDAIVILRNHDTGQTRERIDHAVGLMLSGYTPVLLMTYDSNTYTEAYRVFDIAMKADWKSITIVTHRCHHYRAYLTFAKVFDNAGGGLLCDIRSSPIDDKPTVYEQLIEMQKIDDYIRKGHVATYEEGIKLLE